MLAQSLLLAAMAVSAPPQRLSATHAMGLLELTPARRKSLEKSGEDFSVFAKQLKQAPPPKHEVRWMPKPHPYGQGTRGTCAAWAFAYAGLSCLESRARDVPADSPLRFFSPGFVYSQRMCKWSESPEGMDMFDACEIIWKRGCLPYSEMPYSEATADLPPTPAQQMAAYSYQIAGISVITPLTSANIKAVLADDLPVVFGAITTTAFHDLRGDTVFSDYRTDQISGGHAMCFVGYDDDRGALRLINSWGTDWGDMGYGWVNYDLIDKPADPEKPFCLVAIALLDGPNLTTKTDVRETGGGSYAWEISLQGEPSAFAQVDRAIYLLPGGYEPRVVMRPDAGGGSADPRQFSLRSTDVQPSASVAPLEIWVRFHLKNNWLMQPRPVFIPCGQASSAALAAGSTGRPHAWPQPGPSANLETLLAGSGSASPVERPAEAAPPQVVVPNLVGSDTSLASLQLLGQGFVVKFRRGSDVTVRPAPGARVVEQAPAAGSRVPAGSTIILTVR